MASVQQLEKLYQIQKIFDCGDTLEAAVGGERVAQLILKTEKLIHQRTFLRDERRRLRMATEQIEERKKALAVMGRGDWLPEALKNVDENHVMINVGGLMFEAPVSILKRDSGSLLAQLCDPEPPVQADAEGCFFFDRDWWLFRYILSFLRDGTLPDDRSLLAQLYREAAYWNLKQLQVAIEEDKLHLRKEKLADNEKDLWWRKQPNWWRAMEEEKKKAEADEAAAAKKTEDWWKDTSYKGKVFLPLSSAEDKVVTTAGENDEKKTFVTTWSTKLPSDNDDRPYYMKSNRFY